MTLRRTPIKRSGKPRAKRPGPPRRGQPTKEEKTAVREAVYDRAEGRCELRLVPECSGERVLPKMGWTPWDHAHAVHIKSAGAGGKWTMENIRLGCPACHLVGLHVQGGKGKIVPKKEA